MENINISLKEMKINHPNKRAINWLIYEINDRYLEKYSQYFKGKLVDLGCGEAIYKEYFLHFCDKYIGVDWGNSYHNTSIDIESDLNKRIGLPKNYADTLVSLSVMEHLYNPEKFLKECYRILKPDGYFIIQVPWQWWIHEQPFDFYRYSPFGLQYMLEKAGFNIIELSASSGVFTTLTMKFNYFTERIVLRSKYKKILNFIFRPFWFINQKLAPILDGKFDKEWLLETTGYWIVAQKVINND